MPRLGPQYDQPPVKWEDPRSTNLRVGPPEVSAEQARFGALTPGKAYYTPDGHAHAGFPEENDGHHLKKQVWQEFEAQKEHDNQVALDNWAQGKTGRRHNEEAYMRGVAMREASEGMERQYRRRAQRYANGAIPADSLDLSHPESFEAGGTDPAPAPPISRRHQSSRDAEITASVVAQDAAREAKEAAALDVRNQYRQLALDTYTSVGNIEVANPHIGGNEVLRRTTQTGRYHGMH